MAQPPHCAVLTPPCPAAACASLSLPQTIGAYFGMKQLKVADRMVNLAIWDTAGEEKFDALTSFYCRDAACAVITYGQAAAQRHCQRALLCLAHLSANCVRCGCAGCGL